ncbi:MAG TPA: glycosyltransferase family 4 protein [Allosphingosinicella sp.]|jgi:glycosyltransferase involved in cell wall biosynthesis
MVQRQGRQLPRRIAFVSSNFAWGGSEELWAATAVALAEAGHRVHVFKHGLPRGHDSVRRLGALSCGLHELGPLTRLVGRLPFLAALASPRMRMAVSVAMLWLRLHVLRLFVRRFDVVIISQGGNHDGWPIAALCRRLGLDYALVSHKASDLHWPSDRWRRGIRGAFAHARANYFVSRHTQRLTEEQIGARVDHASLVLNPFNVAWDRPQPWPSANDGLRLGCVGRLNAVEKGQDLLLRVLASDKWRARPLSVTFLGDGGQRAGLEELAAFLRLDSVRFAGVRTDVAAFWADHHALALPSRAEGLPLVLIEALLSGRIAIVTDVGGNAELLEEGVNGFIAEAPTESSLDSALERAWQRRDEWCALGAAAAVRLRTKIPADPAKLFAARILDLVGSPNQGGTACEHSARN